MHRWVRKACLLALRRRLLILDQRFLRRQQLLPRGAAFASQRFGGPSIGVQSAFLRLDDLLQDCLHIASERFGYFVRSECLLLRPHVARVVIRDRTCGFEEVVPHYMGLPRGWGSVNGLRRGLRRRSRAERDQVPARLLLDCVHRWVLNRTGVFGLILLRTVA